MLLTFTYIYFILYFIFMVKALQAYHDSQNTSGVKTSDLRKTLIILEENSFLLVINQGQERMEQVS